VQEPEPAEAPPRPSRWPLAAAVAAAVLAGLLCTLPVLGAGFAPLGDPALLESHDRWHGLGGERFAWMLETVRGGFVRPLAWLSYGLDGALSGPGAAGIHRTSWLLHGLRAALVTVLTVRLLLVGAVAREDGRRRAVLVAAGAAGVLWAIHPLRVEATAWAAARPELLAGVLWLGSAVAFVRAVSGPALRTPALVGAVLLGCLGVYADPLSLGGAIAVGSLVAWIARLDSASFAGQAERGTRSACSLPFLVPILLGVVMAFGVDAAGTPGLDPLARAGALANGTLRVLRTTLWPGWLHPEYGAPPGFPATVGPTLLFDGALLLGLVGYTVHGLLRGRGTGYVGLAFLGLLVPPLLLGHTPFGADRYADLATVPLFIGLADALARPFPSIAVRRAAGAGLLVIAAVLATASVRQSALWTEPDALLDHVLAIDPANEAALVARGEAALPTDDVFASSAAYARRALEGGGARPRAHAFYGRILLELGEPAAEGQLRDAIAAGPWLPGPHHDLGVMLLRRGEFAEALTLFERAARLDSRSAAVWFGVGRARQQLAENADAADAFRRALALEPGDAAIQAALDHVTDDD